MGTSPLITENVLNYCPVMAYFSIVFFTKPKLSVICPNNLPEI